MHLVSLVVGGPYPRFSCAPSTWRWLAGMRTAHFQAQRRILKPTRWSVNADLCHVRFIVRGAENYQFKTSLNTGTQQFQKIRLCDILHCSFSSLNFKHETYNSQWHECVKVGEKHFVLVARKICGIVQIYVRVIGDVKLAANYNAVISLGKEGQTTISHHGKLFPIDSTKS